MKQKKQPHFSPREHKLIRNDILFSAIGMSVGITGMTCYDSFKVHHVTFWTGAGYALGGLLGTYLLCLLIGTPLTYFFYSMKKAFIATCCGTTPEKIDISAEHWR